VSIYSYFDIPTISALVFPGGAASFSVTISPLGVCEKVVVKRKESERKSTLKLLFG